jgi:hypothetical protein
MLLGPRDDGAERPLDPGQHQLSGFPDGERERRVDDVGRREPVVQPPSFCPEPLLHGVDEGGDVVVRLALDLGDALRRGHVRVRPDRGDDPRGDATDLGPAVEGGELHAQPSLELRLLRPDPGHLRSGVASDHRPAL